jgi:hypothetical protein
MNVTDRAEQIQERLGAYIENVLGLTPVDVARSSWTEMQLPHPYRLGWLPPSLTDITREEDGESLPAVTICSELIAATTTWLSQPQLDIYLNALEVFIHAHALDAEGRPADVVNQGVEDLMWREFPGLVPLFSRIEFKALERGML